MSKQCSFLFERDLFLAAAARRIVVEAGEATETGEEVGSIKAQLNRASRRLDLSIGECLRARHGRAGPRAFIKIKRAANKIRL